MKELLPLGSLRLKNFLPLEALVMVFCHSKRKVTTIDSVNICASCVSRYLLEGVLRSLGREVPDGCEPLCKYRELIPGHLQGQQALNSLSNT